MGYTNEWYLSYLTRRGANRNGAAKAGADDESELHEAILAECNRRGWIPFHGSMAHRAMRTKGEPDFVILADGGATILVEAKTRTGKLSTEQLGIQAWAKKLDHTIHVVRSIEEFHNLCKSGKTIQPETK